jgi:hypothetical protein
MNVESMWKLLEYHPDEAPMNNIINGQANPRFLVLGTVGAQNEGMVLLIIRPIGLIIGELQEITSVEVDSDI